jgi:drug/metabolite transporter (DMT)-like permease
LLSILFGLGSALAWGAADFSGGLASKRARPYQVALAAEFAGLLPMLALALSWNEPLPPPSAWLLGAAAGGLGTFGLTILYRALADGQMSIAAPVSALLAAVLPVLAGALMLGLPDALTLAAFGLALISIWMFSQDGAAADWRLNLRTLGLPLLSGLFFGSFFILMPLATQEATFWPLVSGRLGGTLVMLAYAAAVRASPFPGRAALGISALCGVVDVLGSVCYVLAARTGRLDVAAVLAALYPGLTVILAWLFLKERISTVQAVGILLALGAIVLMTL